MLNLISLVIPNVAVLLFPSWLQGSKDSPQGIEATGQRLIYMIALPGSIRTGVGNNGQGCDGRASVGPRVRPLTALKGLRPTAPAAQRARTAVRAAKHPAIYPE